MCPACGSVRRRVRLITCDNVGRKLRYGVCLDCSRKYSTLEVTVPDPHSAFTLSGLRKQQNRERERRRRGYHGTAGGSRTKPEPVLDVKIRVRTVE